MHFTLWRSRPSDATTTEFVAEHPKSREVTVQLVNTSFNSRKLNATLQVGAPLDIVWEALTDYDNLGTFIPNLVENRCLERRPQGCLLYQVGAQDIALGVKFTAACTLEIQEYPTGIPDGLCAVDGNWDDYFPQPGSSSSSSSAAGNGGGSSSGAGGSSSQDSAGPAAVSGFRDISFSLVQGDFQAFKGIWRLEPGDNNSTVLHYALFVQPHAWLPVVLIQNRVRSEMVNNLEAIRRHAEHLHKHQQRQQQAQLLSGHMLSSASFSSTASSICSGLDADEEDAQAQQTAALCVSAQQLQLQ